MSVASIYTNHHKEGKRLGSSILSFERGELISKYIGAGKRVLDVGCRDGVLTETYCTGNEVVGVDVDAKALREASRRLSIETIQFDVTEDWPLEEKSFDAVVAGEVLEHLYFPEKIVKKISIVLKQEGVFVGSVPNAFSLKNRVRLFMGNKKNTPLHDPTHINHFKYSEIKEMMERYFEKVEIIPLGNFAWVDKFLPGMFSFGLFFVAQRVKKDLHE